MNLLKKSYIFSPNANCDPACLMTDRINYLPLLSYALVNLPTSSKMCNVPSRFSQILLIKHIGCLS